VPTLAPPPMFPAPAPQYEFGEAENAVIGNLGSKMSFVGLFMLGIGLFFFGTAMVRWVQSQELEVGVLFLALLFIVVGIPTHRAGREFRLVADTQGKDISHLMGAIDNLLRLYRLFYYLFFVALVFAIIQLGAHSLKGKLPDLLRPATPVQLDGLVPSGSMSDKP
jgi:hypothetical protein